MNDITQKQSINITEQIINGGIGVSAPRREYMTRIVHYGELLDGFCGSSLDNISIVDIIVEMANHLCVDNERLTVLAGIKPRPWRGPSVITLMNLVFHLSATGL